MRDGDTDAQKQRQDDITNADQKLKALEAQLNVLKLTEQQESRVNKIRIEAAMQQSRHDVLTSSDEIKIANSLLSERERIAKEISRLEIKGLKNGGLSQEDSQWLEVLNGRVKELWKSWRGLDEETRKDSGISKRVEELNHLIASQKEQQEYQGTEDKIKKLESALASLTTAQKNYRAALKLNDSDLVSQRKNEITAAQDRLDSIKKELNESK